MTVTKVDAAGKIASYLQHQITLAELVNWSENAIMDATFPESESEVLSRTLARLGLADVRAFGLAWEDCEQLLHDLGFAAHIDIVAA